MYIKLKNIYNRINNKFLMLGIFIKRIYFDKRLLNSVRKNIKGKNNLVQYEYAILNNVFFDMVGNWNSIIIDQGSRLNNVVFFIRGDNHKIRIGKECTCTRGGNIWFEHYDGLLEIGDKITIENVHIAITELYSKVVIGGIVCLHTIST